EQVAHRRALVAADVGDARLQQRLGHGQDAFAIEGLAGAQPQALDLLVERDFSHGRSNPLCADATGSPPPRGGRTERHGLSSPIATVNKTPTGELSPMAFLVGVSLAVAAGHPHPTRPAT